MACPKLALSFALSQAIPNFEVIFLDPLPFFPFHHISKVNSRPTTCVFLALPFQMPSTSAATMFQRVNTNTFGTV